MIPQTELYKALKVAADFVDDSKPGLHVVHFNFYNVDNFEAVATDGHSLVIVNFQVPHGIVGRFSIPLPMIEDLLKMFPPTPGTEVTLAAWEGQLMFTNGLATHMVKGVPPEDFPPYADIVGRLTPVAEPVYLDSRRVADMIKYCKPILRKKSGKDEPFKCPALRIMTVGAKSSVAFRFDLDEDLEAITNLDTYIMYINDVSF